MAVMGLVAVSERVRKAYVDAYLAAAYPYQHWYHETHKAWARCDYCGCKPEPLEKYPHECSHCGAPLEE